MSDLIQSPAAAIARQLIDNNTRQDGPYSLGVHAALFVLAKNDDGSVETFRRCASTLYDTEVMGDSREYRGRCMAAYAGFADGVHAAIQAYRRWMTGGIDLVDAAFMVSHGYTKANGTDGFWLAPKAAEARP